MSSNNADTNILDSFLQVLAVHKIWEDYHLTAKLKADDKASNKLQQHKSVLFSGHWDLWTHLSASLVLL